MLKTLSLLILLNGLLIGCSTAMPTVSAGPASADRAPMVMRFDQATHFTAPDGTPVLVLPEEYLVEPTADAQLRLMPLNGGEPLLLAAEPVTHDIDLSSSIPLLLALNEDSRNVVWLNPDGTALDAVGSLSGVRSHSSVRARRHYQLVYQLDPATGRLTFGDGEIGRRPNTKDARLSPEALMGVGTAGNVEAGAHVSNIEIQSLLSNYNQAETLASNVLKKLDDGFPLEDNRDHPGGDYAQQVQPSAVSCRAMCAGDGTCQAFTFVKPPAGAASGQCFLKRTVPAAVENPCCVSGRKTLRMQQKIN
jgi:hypothetical protein